MRLGMVRLGLQHRLELCGGFVHPPPTGEDKAQVVMGLRVVGPEFHRRLIMARSPRRSGRGQPGGTKLLCASG